MRENRIYQCHVSICYRGKMKAGQRDKKTGLLKSRIYCGRSDEFEAIEFAFLIK